MKKFLIGVLAMIPVIVVLALSATGTLIALTTPVNPESIEVRTEENLPVEGEIHVELNNTEQFIIIEVLPAISYSKEIEYEFDEEYGEGEVELERIDDTNRYRIIPVASGVARMTIRAKANFNAYTSVTFVIASEVIREVTIYDDDGNTVDGTLEPLGAMQLHCDIYPIDALSGSDVEWTSSAPNVVHVSKNGYITPISRGYATVTVSARSKIGVRREAKVEVNTTGALVSRTEAYTTEIPDTAWVKRNLVLDANAEVSDNGDGSYTVRSGQKSVTVRVEETEAGAWGFVDGLSVIYKNNGPAFAEIARLEEDVNGERLNAVLVSSDPAVLSVLGDELIPVGAGKATLTATINGKSVSKEIVVKERPMTFDLDMTAADGRLGIGMTRVWGTQWFRYEDGLDILTNEYQFGAKNWTGDNFDLLWASSDPETVRVDQTGKITFMPEARGKEVVISATVMVNNRLTNVRRSFTFRMAEESDCVNVTDFDSLYRLGSWETESVNRLLPVLQSNIVPEEVIGDRSLFVYRGLYGNGFLIDYGNWQDPATWMSIVHVVANRVNPDLVKEGETVKVVDVQVRGAIDYENCGGHGRGIYMCYVEVPILLKNLVVYNCDNGIYMNSPMDVTIEGCILGDNWYTNVAQANDPKEDGNRYKLTLINNVLKQTRGPSLMINSNVWNNDTFGKQILPTLEIKGFLDMYNWKQPEAAKNLITELDPSIFSALGDFIDPHQLLEAIGMVFDQLLSTEAYSNIFYADKKGTKWLCMGGFFLGALMPVDLNNLTVEDPRFTTIRMPLNATEVDGIAGIMIGVVEAIMQSKGLTVSNDCYLLCYDFTKGDPAIKPGDPIPNDRALFERLNQGVAA